MKKFLRFIGVLLLIIIAGVVIMGLVAPKDITSERSVVINAPKERVMAHMFKYENFNSWNPFRDLDTTMVSSVTGTDGTPGAKYEWKGNDDMGSGEMVTKEVTGDEMKYDMRFIEPFESEAKGYWRVEEAGNGQSKAIWGFSTHAGFPMNGLMMLFGMKKNLEKDFDKGLGRLKTYVEAHANDEPASGYSITDTQFPGGTYATLRQKTTTDMDVLMKFFDESYQKLGKAAGSRITGPATCLGYGWDEKANQADLAAAFPVSGADPVAGATMVTVPPSQAIMTVHTGGYGSMMNAHQALGEKSGGEPALVVEEYVKGPGEEKDSTKWVTNIYYLKK